MYLLYVDESGPVDKPDVANIVFGGVALHESMIGPLTRLAQSVLTKYLDPHLLAVEIHAQHMRTGRGVWRSIAKETRFAILAELCAQMSDFQLANPQKFAAIAIVREPGAIPGVEPMHRIYEELLLRFHRILEINRDRGLVIADKSRHESRVQPVVANWQQGSGTRFGKLHRIMEVPLFLVSLRPEGDQGSVVLPYITHTFRN